MVGKTSKPKITVKSASSSATKIEDRYRKELPPKGSAKYKAYVMQGLIKEK